MPFPTPFNALVIAYQVYYLQCVRYIIKYLNYTCEFNKVTLKKYSYYII
jgi:hypothetical protein